MIRTIVALALGAGLFGLVAWQFELGPFATDTDPKTPSQIKQPAQPKLGDFLYPPSPFPKESALPLRRGDPVVIQATLSPMDKIDVSAKASGQLLLIGDLVPEGAVQAAGTAAFIAEPYYPVEIPLIGGRKMIQIYQRFYEGSILGRDQMIGLVDPAKALSDIELKRARVQSAIAERDSAKALLKEYTIRFDREETLRRQGTGTAAEWGAAKASMDKAFADDITKAEGVKFSTIEEKLAILNYYFHEVRNPILVNRSIIRTLYKKGHESVKELDPVAQVYSLDRLLAEGFLEIQYASRIREGALVSIEPTRESEPLKVFAGHRGAVNAVAVTNIGPPLAVSASDDQTVCVWTQASKGPWVELRHGHKVLAVACSPAALKRNLILAGDDAGNITLWDLATKESVFKNKEAYKDNVPVTSLAFTPDGKFFATGSAAGVIKLWETETGKEAWTLDAEHGAPDSHSDAITSMHFTPQCRLISASRDNTVRVWAVYHGGAKLEYDPVAGRTGSIPGLGVSRDGRWMLFDQGKILQMRSVEEGKMINFLKNPQGGSPFESVAIFSPEGTLMLTGGAADGRLQLFHAPQAGERGFEIRQFTPEERGRVTCANFAPVGADGQSAFAVSGNKDGFVYLWPIPNKADVEGHRIPNVRVTLVSTNLDAGTRQIRVGVEVPNPTGQLLPGRPVTIVID